jgi:DNA-binding NarL/FixJ family response regulator
MSLYNNDKFLSQFGDGKGWRGMRIIVADDQPEVRSALRLMLEEKPGNNIIAEASTSYELLWQVSAVNPDLLLLDWELPGTQPKELLSILLGLYPRLLVIALSSRPQAKQVALEAGAHNFVSKSDPPENLLSALEDCYGNRKGLSKGLK